MIEQHRKRNSKPNWHANPNNQINIRCPVCNVRLGKGLYSPSLASSLDNWTGWWLQTGHTGKQLVTITGAEQVEAIDGKLHTLLAEVQALDSHRDEGAMATRDDEREQLLTEIAALQQLRPAALKSRVSGEATTKCPKCRRSFTYRDTELGERLRDATTMDVYLPN